METIGKSRLQCGGRKKFRAGCGELDRERQPVNLSADCCNCPRIVCAKGKAGIHRPGTLNKQGDCGIALGFVDRKWEVWFGRREGRNGKFLLGSEVKRDPTRDENLQVRTRTNECADGWRSLHNLLEIVEHEQMRAPTEPASDKELQRYIAGGSKA